MSLSIVPTDATIRDTVTDAEWQARVDLAACYRLVDHYDMTDLALTHIAARVPDEPDAILLNPWGVFFEEITASSLIKMGLDGEQRSDSAFEVNRTAYVIHSAIAAARPDVACSLHTHTRAGMAVSSLDCGLLPMTQHALMFHGRTGYHDYEGVAVDEAEQARLAGDLADNRALILRNHGLLTVGRSIPEAFILIYYLEKACQAQVDAMACGTPLTPISDSTIEKTTAFFTGGTEFADKDWPAHLRRLDRLDPSYRE
ncbi:MAG: class II aldolase/adducin family protein [Rhodospirillales bacterium]|jgi:ribulose-5-phosphate 4-epimerase/fuculose-1-phosphate aldolase|nr:class II aldolase/adducin family protein [Alphaproteobacteria bacterium]MDP6884632.1 class II aldolase/adducin family protein [Rhodospirillales bacterium]